MIGCTVTDIALVLGCDRDTIHRRFSAELLKGKAKSRTKLRRLMWQSAEKGNIVMQIFLSKQYLKFSDEGITSDDYSDDELLNAARSEG